MISIGKHDGPMNFMPFDLFLQDKLSSLTRYQSLSLMHCVSVCGFKSLGSWLFGAQIVDLDLRRKTGLFSVSESELWSPKSVSGLFERGFGVEHFAFSNETSWIVDEPRNQGIWCSWSESGSDCVVCVGWICVGWLCKFSCKRLSNDEQFIYDSIGAALFLSRCDSVNEQWKRFWLLVVGSSRSTILAPNSQDPYDLTFLTRAVLTIKSIFKVIIWFIRVLLPV